MLDDHGHLVDVKARAILCSCRGCYLLFTPGGAGGGHFKAIPDRYLDVSGEPSLQAAWAELQIPVGVAFFFRNSFLDRAVALYPGPAGATESELAVLDTIQLSELETDVEAVLVRAGRGASAGSTDGDAFEAFVVPIDVCYELVGRLRQVWRGFDGGREAHETIDQLFARLQDRAS
jgi:hypothetical protein